MELTAGTIVERYRVEGRLGAGGMASVYRVRHQDLGTVHALKVLHLPSPELRERLLQEGRLQGALRHPNVLAVTDLVDVDGSPGLVLEYVEGESLADVLRDRRLSLDEADHLARRVMVGVAAAHRHGLIHRDLKPANVLVAVVDGTPLPKVADFGLARALVRSDEPLTSTGMSMGTPCYMAPEQASDSRSVDARADVFSLGALLFELVTGTRAFPGSSLVQIVYAAASGAYRDPRELVPELPERMAKAIEGALEPDPDRRTPSCEALLELWTAGSQVAEPTGWSLPARPLGLEEEPTAGAAAPPGLHPPLEELLDRPDDADVTAHLASCAACRVEVRLFEETFELEPARPTRHLLPHPALAAAFSLPVLLGITSVLAGGVDRIGDVGPFAWAVLVTGAASVGGMAWLGRRLEEGRGVALGSWGLLPAVMLAVGFLGSGVGSLMALRYLEGAGPAERAVAAPMAVGVALTTRWAALTVAALVLSATAWTGVAVLWPGRRRVGGRRPGLVLGAALLGGTALFLAQELIAGTGGAALFPLVVLAVTGGAVVLTAGRPEDETCRSALALVQLAGVGAVASAAAAVDVGVERRLFGLIDRAPPEDRLLAAEAFVDALAGGTVPLVLAWTALAVVVALVAGRSVPRIGVGAGAALLLGAAALAAVSLAARGPERQLQQLIAPAFLDRTVDWYFPGLVLVDSDRPEDGWQTAAIRVAEPLDGLRVGDRLVAIDGVPVPTVRQLIGLLRPCLCERGGDCPLERCLEPGARIEVQVVRGGRLGEGWLGVAVRE